MTRLKILVPALSVALALSACSSLQNDVGSLFGEPQPTLYERLSDDDVALAAKAVQTTLEKEADGKSRAWRNPKSGASGSIQPVRTRMTTAGLFCRDYRETVAVAGETATYDNSACRNKKGRWVWTS